MKKLTSFFLAALMCLSLITYIPPVGNDDEPPEPPEITDIVPPEPDDENHPMYEYPGDEGDHT